MKKEKRFLPLKGYKGIRKDVVTGKLLCRKYFGKEEFSKTFDNVSDAVKWRNSFHPLLTESEIKSSKIINHTEIFQTKCVQSKLNGADQRFSFGDVWLLYQKQHFPTLEPETASSRIEFAKKFFPELMNLKMVELNPELIDAFINKKVQDALVSPFHRRLNFDNDLKCLKAFLNWYRENYDGLFVVPILKRHFAAGIIRKVVKSKKKMSLEQVKLFLNSFTSQFWSDFAEIHFFMAGRCQEPAGLQLDSAIISNGFVEVCDVAIWGKDKKFSRLKEKPKNGETRVIHMNNRMKKILERRILERPNKPFEYFRESNNERLNFVFHLKGEPVTYRQIQYHYNRSLKRAGLFPQFSSTHILRKAMANIVRGEMGLDAAQAAGGWKSREVVEKIYTNIPDKLNVEAVDRVEKMISEGDIFDSEVINDLSNNTQNGGNRLEGGNKAGRAKLFKLKLVE